MLFLLQHISVTARPEGVLPYRYIGAEIAPPPFETGVQCIKLDFAEAYAGEITNAFSAGSDGNAWDWLPNQEDAVSRTFSVWVPKEYPALASLRLRILDSHGRSGMWVLEDLPQPDAQPPKLRESDTLAPGVIVTGRAWVTQQFDPLRVSLTMSSPPRGPDWFWEAVAQSPYGPKRDRDEEQEWGVVGDPSLGFIYIGGNMLLSVCDREAVWGDLTHFRSFKETTTCQARLEQDSATGRWMWNEDPIVVTPSGMRFRIYQLNEDLDRKPENKGQIRFEVEFDKATIASGIGCMPDRIELRISPPESPGSSQGLSVPLLLKHQTSWIWTLNPDQIKPVIDFRISVNRRVADRKIPFSLVIPIERPKYEPIPPAPRSGP